MSNIFKLSFVSSLLVLVAACGDTDLERAATGALIGGATAHVIGEDVAGGALIGGAYGGTCATLGTC